MGALYDSATNNIRGSGSLRNETVFRCYVTRIWRVAASVCLNFSLCFTLESAVISKIKDVVRIEYNVVLSVVRLTDKVRYS